MEVVHFDFSHYIRKPPKVVLIFSGRESYTMIRKIAPGLLNSVRDITMGAVFIYIYDIPIYNIIADFHVTYGWQIRRRRHRPKKR